LFNDANGATTNTDYYGSVTVVTPVEHNSKSLLGIAYWSYTSRITITHLLSEINWPHRGNSVEVVEVTLRVLDALELKSCGGPARARVTGALVVSVTVSLNSIVGAHYGAAGGSRTMLFVGKFRN
jgi:hypothetical protein